MIIFTEYINKERDDFYSFNKKLIDLKLNEHETIPLVALLDDYEHNCFYADNNKFNEMVVGLKGARLYSPIISDPKNNFPSFKRWSYYSLVDGVYLNIIDDPMYRKHHWFAIGLVLRTKEHLALELVVKLVLQVSRFKAILTFLFFNKSRYCM